MKKYILLLLAFAATSIGYSQTIPSNSRLKITKNAEDSTATRIVVQSATDELNYIYKDSLKSQMGLSNAVTGTGLTNQIVKWNSANEQTNSQISDDGTLVNIGNSLRVNGASTFANAVNFSNGRLYQFLPTSSNLRLVDSSFGYELMNFDSGGHAIFGGNISLSSGGYIYGDTTTPFLRLSQDNGTFLQYGDSGIWAAGSLTDIFATDRVTLSTAGYERVRVASNGKVGIGTINPLSKLHSFTGLQADAYSLAYSTAFFEGADVGLAIGQKGSSGYGTWIQSTNEGNTPFPLYINPNGSNVLIGTTTENGSKLRVNGSGWFDGDLQVSQPYAFKLANGQTIRDDSSAGIEIAGGTKLTINSGVVSIINGFSSPASETGYRLKFYDNGGTNNDSGIGLSGSAGLEKMWFNSWSGFSWNEGTKGEAMSLSDTGRLTLNNQIWVNNVAESSTTIIDGQYVETGVLNSGNVNSGFVDVYDTLNVYEPPGGLDNLIQIYANSDGLVISGGTTISTLSGSGTRTVVADSSGHLSTISTDSRPYKVWSGLLTQSGTSNPTAIVLENTMGHTVTWTRVGTGAYKADADGTWVMDKTVMIPNNPNDSTGTSTSYLSSSSDIRLYTSTASAASDGILQKTFVEIRTYN